MDKKTEIKLEVLKEQKAKIEGEIKVLMQEANLIEEWKPVLDFETYEVSNHGRVRSVYKDGFITILKQHGDNPYVSLFYEGKQYNKSVAILVATAFLGYKKGDKIEHIDVNNKNNDICNIRLGL